MKNLTTLVICFLLLVAGCIPDGSGGGNGPNADELVPGAGAEDYAALDYESESVTTSNTPYP